MDPVFFPALLIVSALSGGAMVGIGIGNAIRCLRESWGKEQKRGSEEGTQSSFPTPLYTPITTSPQFSLYPWQRDRESDRAVTDRVQEMMAQSRNGPELRELLERLTPEGQAEVVPPPESWLLGLQSEPPLYPRLQVTLGDEEVQDLLRGDQMFRDAHRPTPREYREDGLEDPFAAGQRGYRYEGGRRQRL